MIHDMIHDMVHGLMMHDQVFRMRDMIDDIICMIRYGCILSSYYCSDIFKVSPINIVFDALYSCCGVPLSLVQNHTFAGNHDDHQ